jgi:hypothetical protein
MMPEETKTTELALEACKECKHWQEIKQRLRISRLLLKTIDSIEGRLQSSDFKPTLGDYLKLLQIEKEMEEVSPKEIRVTWVNPPKKSDTEK